MGTFAVGDVVLITFPYADFSKFKKRPALVVGRAEFDNLILCQITSKAETSKRALLLTDQDFRVGSLHLDSYIRPDKLFTVETTIIEKIIGRLHRRPKQTVLSRVRSLFEDKT